MSFRKYKVIDLSIFIILYIALEFLISLGATKWFPEQPFIVSIMLPMLLIVMMRWDKWSIFFAIISGVFYPLIYHGDWSEYLIYLLGNLGFMILLLFLFKVGKKRIKDSIFLTVCYTLIGFLLLEIFRGLGAIIFNGSNIIIIWKFIWTDMLSLIFSLLVILISRHLDGIFEDQKAYCFRKQKEREKEGEIK